MILPSKAYEEYEANCRYFIKDEYKVNIDYPVNIKCTFYMPTARRVDLTNLLEAVDDMLVKYDVLFDDNYNIVQSHDGSRVYIDRENPRTIIEITR